MDFATLVLGADTRDLKRADDAMEGIVRTGAKTQSAVDKVGDSFDKTGVDARNASGGFKKASDELDQIEPKSVSAAGGVTRLAVAFGTALAASQALRQIVSVNVEFGASMSRVGAISGATADELDQLRKTALKMGADTAFSAAQAADALGFLAMAGFSAAEAMTAIPDVLALAAASGMDLALAADIASNVLSGFGLQAEEAARVADVLADAASSTNTNVEQLGQAMSTAAPIAAALGISMEETAAAIGVMSDAGIQGERAGTALRGVFASLAGPTSQAQDALAKYGLTAAQIDPQTVGLAAAMATLRDANISTADAFEIFGREAASGALVMAETAERMDALTGQFEGAEGAAQEMATTMRDNLAGDIDQLTGSIETMIVALGDAGVTGSLRSMAQVGTSAVNALGQNMNSLISIVTGAVTAFGTYRLALLASSAASSTLVTGLIAQAHAMRAATAGMGVLGTATAVTTAATRTFFGVLAANPFGVAAIAVGVLVGAMMNLRSAQAAARAETDALVRSLQSLRGQEFITERSRAQMRLQRRQEELADINRAKAQQEQLLRFAPGAKALVGAFNDLEGKANSAKIEIFELQNGLARGQRQFEQTEAEATKLAQGFETASVAAGGLSGETAKATRATRANTSAVDEASKAYDAFVETVAKANAAVSGMVRGEVEAYDQRVKATEDVIKGLEREIEQLTLNGAELRQLEIVRLMEAAATQQQKDRIDDLNAARETAISQARREADAVREASEARQLEADNIARVARNLGLLGGLFGQDIGGLVNSVLQTEVVVKGPDGKPIAESIGTSIARALEKVAPGFGQAVSAAVQGAVLGQQANLALGGRGGTGSQVGGAIGGAIGSFIPIPGAQIVGSILGGLVGGLFDGVKRASTTIQGIGGKAVQSAISGDNSKLRGVADSLANGLIGGLGNIAEALGGEIGNFAAISIGTRKGTFRVDTSGQGRTAKMPSFETEAQAVAFALETAIQRGAITGLRAGTQALLTASGDLEAGLSRALAFEDVFKRLERETDPLAFALGELDKEFAGLRKLFDDAGASVEEYAQLEQLLQIERTKAMEQFGESIAENTELLREQRQLEARILELQGDSLGALTILRQLELEAADATLRPLMEQIYALEDQAAAARNAAELQEEAARVAEQAAQAILEAERRIADERRGLETRYLNLIGDTAALRERELAAIDPANRSLLQVIFNMEDLQASAAATARAAEELARVQEQAAQDALRAAEEQTRAAEEAARAAEQAAQTTRNLTIRLMEAQGNAMAALTMRRQDELDGLTASDQAIARQIFALEDAARAQQEYEEALSATRASLQARRQEIENELSPLRSELERLVAAVTPEAQDLLAAMRVRDVSSEGLALAERIADASRSILADNEQVAMMQRAAARRELFQMAETGRFNASRFDQILGSATSFDNEFGDPVEQLRQQALTANTLAVIAAGQERIAEVAQMKEEMRAAEAREQVLEQIDALEFQITQGEASLRSLDRIEDSAVSQRRESQEQSRRLNDALSKQIELNERTNKTLADVREELAKSRRLLELIEENGAT